MGPSTTNSWSRRRGQTLRDWLVAGAILGVLLLALIPWIVNSRGSSRRELCQHRLQQLSMAMGVYHERSNQLPFYRSQPAGAWKDLAAQSWAATILPGLARSEGAFPPGGLAPEARLRIPELICPDRPWEEADPGPILSYVINSGQPDANPPLPLPPDGIASGISFDGLPLEPERRLHLSLRDLNDATRFDGIEHTLLAAENLDAGQLTDTTEARLAFLWTPSLLKDRPASALRIEPINARRGEGDGSARYARPSSLHGAGVNGVFASGRIQWIDEKIDELVWFRYMASHDDGVTDPETGLPLGEPYR